MAAGRSVTQLSVGQVLQSNSRKYTILEIIGEGSYGKVAKCRIGATKELVAVKIFKEADCVVQELYILRKLSRVDSEKINVIKFYESFCCSGFICLVFELLAVDLFNHLSSPMWAFEIRPIAKQMLQTLQVLKDLKIIHVDIKPNNIMLADIGETAKRVKLIDFGLAIPSFYATYGSEHQVIGYRAPEITLGLPFTEAIDMWGLGCTLAFLYLRDHLFPFSCEYLIMKSMVESLGMPSDEQLKHGIYTERFFLEEDECGSRWRLLTPEEYDNIHKELDQEMGPCSSYSYSLDGLHDMYEDIGAEEMKDRKAFIDFLKQLLLVDHEKRISPEAALQHPFITMSHLSQDPGSSDYLTMANKVMSTSGPPSSDVGHEDNDEGRTVPLTASPGQSERSEGNVAKDLCLHPHEDEQGIQSCQEPCSVSREETLDLVSSGKGLVVEDVPTGNPIPTTTPTPTPTPTATLTLSPTPTPTLSPNLTLSPTPTPTTTPTATPTLTLSPTPTQPSNATPTPTPATKRSSCRRIRKFFSRIRKTVFSCFSS